MARRYACSALVAAVLALFAGVVPASGQASGGSIEVGTPGPPGRVEAAPGDANVFIAPRAFPADASDAVVAATSTFQITYKSGFPETHKPAVQAAVDIWSGLVTSSVPIRFQVGYTSQGPGALGFGGPVHIFHDFANAPVADTWYPSPIAEALSGQNLGGADFDMFMDIANRSDWYLGTDGQTPSSRFDLVSVVLHEMLHGLGFSATMTVTSGRGKWGIGTPARPEIFDRFAEDGSGVRLLDTSTYPNNSAALADALRSGAVFFDSPATNRNNNDRPQLYAPATWNGGSSFAHLDEVAYPTGSANTLMTPIFRSAEAIHAPGPLAMCVLEAIGWVTPQDCTPPPITSVTGFGWYSDGGVPSDTTVTAYATGVLRDTAYQLVTGLDGGPQRPCMWDVVPINPNVRTSSNSGFIGNTRGTVTRGPGAWQVCFREVGPGGTLRVSFPLRLTIT